MKKTVLVAMASATLLFTGCEELENLCGIGADDLSFTEDYNKHFNAAVYVYQQIDRVMRDTTLENAGIVEIDGANCTKTADSVIVDYGNGAVGADGKVRKGSIRIGYTGDYMTPGSTNGVMLKNYRENDQMYVGDLIVNNTTVGANPTQFTIALNEFRADTLKLFGNLTADWITGVNTPNLGDDSFEMMGGATLENTNNMETFNGTINSPLLIDAACDFTFVSGVLDLAPSDPKYPGVMLDFIDGDCANLFQATIDCEGNNLSFSYPIK